MQISKRSFADGPLRITRPGAYHLSESVVVDFGKFGLPPLPGEGNHLGFWAAIVVESSGVEIDFHGHTLRMSDSYAAQQRFFSLIELDRTPFPEGKLGFQVEPRSPSDIVLRNGVLGRSSHFGVHAAKAGSRIEIRNLRFEQFEVGAISISGASDLRISDCGFGPPRPPTSTTQALMLSNLERGVRNLPPSALPEEEKEALVAELARLRALERPPRASDALVRVVVVVPSFNVGKPSKQFSDAERIHRVCAERLTFDHVVAQPVEVIGVRGRDGKPMVDVHGDLLSWEDASQGSPIGKAQAALTPSWPASVRSPLLSGRGVSLPKFSGRDRRNHDLLEKASCFLRVDGADHVKLAEVRGKTVTSSGSHAAAAGVILNGCRDVKVTRLDVGGVQVTSSSSPRATERRVRFLQERPASGVLMRRCEHVAANEVAYRSSDEVAVVLEATSDASFVGCDLAAPFVCQGAERVRME